ncbi:ribonuclease Z [Saliterribacillus persicus]|uniref:Ribonuclease Z n=1 Tax=Saliterribacillus persicus TaxID=930114 RepID=A0A368XA59_9BACI|nr:ribonuclease Z [Saliterribacillus persicus]RCW64842.1 RNAse Z [Saliterribacillus persicus]
MELLFLGTGSGMPSKQRNTSSVLLNLVEEIDEIWMFDCGEATQHQLLHVPIRPRKITKIFITHLHGDHIFGLPGFLSSRSFLDGRTTVTVYGPKGIKDFIKMSLEISNTHLAYELKIVELDNEFVFETDKFSVISTKLDHGVASYGFKIIEKDSPGELLVDKLRELNIPPGPLYQRIKEENVVEMENGRVLKQRDFLGPDKKGRSVAILGDTRYKPDLVSFLDCVDVCVHEATFSEDEKTLAHNYFHSTTRQAATLAKASQVNQLILTHISARYQKSDYARILEEAKSIFPATSLAMDYFSYKIHRMKPIN